MQPAQPPCGSRRGRGAPAVPRAPLPVPRRRLLLVVVIVYLVGGSDVLPLTAAAAPARRLGAAAFVEYDVVGTRPIPGDVLPLTAAVAPARRLGAAASVGYDVVGTRPIPGEAVASSPSPSSTPSAVGLADNKRPVPSCPDALHNR
uniref:Uncharacterized protein n=1 Tax=Hordeum vulgare subsp. vulgare TaxID=112509 RepID=A0A8I6X9Z8_HORVV